MLPQPSTEPAHLRWTWRVHRRRFTICGIIVAIFAAILILFIRIRRAIRNGGLLPCPRCRHPVVADRAEGLILCPECGYRNRIDLVRDAWAARYWVNLDHLRTADAEVAESSTAAP